MLKIQRHSEILKYLESHSVLKINDIAAVLGCSEETVRKDLIELEHRDELTRTRGGAYLKNAFEKGIGNDIKQNLLVDEKKYIAGLAFKHILAKKIIVLDSSTTCVELAKYIVTKDIYVSIITNSLSIATICSASDKINLILIGGNYNKKTHSFYGYSALEQLKLYGADLCFLSFTSIHQVRGLGDNSLDGFYFRKACLDIAKTKILVMDHTKFNDDTAIVYGPIGKLDIVITDKKLNGEWLEFFNLADVAVEY
ncbi:DeoR/GlpR family DNA-binding transcription regulator [Peptoniphilus equinus]|uniref:DeoR/GlpR family DNA-binding transcription regulator n=1 Tax=Peptoniphilus equinus TaxID=3016343 RepID=A0ABY7QTT4_9FIRM|nr:DeoR/GlpR family DNA-binding transcription regulator [Peptoniphilus equinus]WBW49553.1 DeoR/GlpR family DNA-binding transcription regulator [Peptoniphilus equinus]